MKLLIFSIMVIFTINLSAQVPTAGLTGYWPFTGNANDESGSGYHGVAEGALLTIDRHGVPNSAYHFNSYFSQVVLNNNLPIINSNQFTIAGWAIMDGPGGGIESQNTLFEQRGDDASPSGARSAIVLMPEHQDGSARFIVRSSINVYGSTIQVTCPSAGYGVWHHYAGVLDESDTLRFYIDAVEVGKTAYTQEGDFITDICFVDFGNHRHTGGYHGVFNGDIDDVRIYSRGLIPEEISALYFTTGICESGGSAELCAYPVPASDILAIDIGGNFNPAGHSSIIVTNLRGVKVLEIPADSRHITIDVSGWQSKGCHFLQLKNPGGNPEAIRKIVVL